MTKKQERIIKEYENTKTVTIHPSYAVIGRKVKSPKSYVARVIGMYKRGEF